MALHELHGGGAVVEAEPQGQGEAQLQQGDPQGGAFEDLVVVPVQQQQQPHPQEGEEDQDGEDW